MPMVDVGVVRMPVDHRRVSMDMDVRLARWVAWSVPMPVVLVVDMGVLVRHLLVGVLVLVSLREVQVEANTHQARGDEQLNGDRLPEHDDRERRSNERGHREIGAGSRRAEVPQGKHKAGEADAVSEEADCGRGQGDAC
jgi:hypothetical protein